MKVTKWTVVCLTALALVACGSPAANNTSTPVAQNGGATAAAGNTTAAPAANTGGETVARVDNVVLSRTDLDTRVNRILEAIKNDPNNQGQGQLPSNIDVEKSLVDLFVQQNLFLNIARAKGVTVTDQQVDAEIQRIGESIAGQGGGTLDQVVTSQLGYENSTAPEFRQLISSIVAQQALGETLVTTDTVRQELQTQYEAEGKEEVEKGDVAHILFSVNAPEDDAAVKAKAEDTIKRLNNGEDFATLAKELSEDPGSKDNGGEYKDITRGEFVPEFDKAMFEDLQPGETTAEPVKTQFGYHIIKLISRTKGPRYTADQITQKVEEETPFVLNQRRQEELQKLLEEERTKAKAEGRLVEPTYPEPTPEVPGELPEDIAPAGETAEPEATTQP